jgi:tol-pal system protein YbgF
LASTRSSKRFRSSVGGSAPGIGWPVLAAWAFVTAWPWTALAQQPAQQNRNVIELMNQIQVLGADLNRLRGELEVLNHSLENAQRRQRDMYLDLDTRLRRLEGTGPEATQKQDKTLADIEARVKRLEEPGAAASAGAELETRIKRLETQMATARSAAPAPPPAAPTGATAPAAATGAAGPRPAAEPSEASPNKRAYDTALSTYRSGDYQGAIAAFDTFIKRYPRDPLAPNAQYWIGDAWFNLRDFRAAANAQQALISNYPDSPKVPDAMLNLSSSQIALGDSAAARKTLEELVNRHPQSDAAERARQRLPKLR